MPERRGRRVIAAIVATAALAGCRGEGPKHEASRIPKDPIVTPCKPIDNSNSIGCPSGVTVSPYTDPLYPNVGYLAVDNTIKGRYIVALQSFKPTTIQSTENCVVEIGTPSETPTIEEKCVDQDRISVSLDLSKPSKRDVACAPPATRPPRPGYLCEDGTVILFRSSRENPAVVEVEVQDNNSGKIPVLAHGKIEGTGELSVVQQDGKVVKVDAINGRVVQVFQRLPASA